MLKWDSRRALLVALVWSILSLTSSACAAEERSATAKQIEALIAKLGSGKFQERRAAQKALEKIGVPALEQLRHVPTTDLETSKRAAELIRAIEEKILTESLLAAKHVHLKVNDMPALDAVNELARLSGAAIHVIGNRAKVADRKITLDTGKVTFWQACDQLCAQAGLVELAATPPPPTTGIRFSGIEIPGAESEAGVTLVPGKSSNQHVSYAGSVRALIYPVSEANTKHYTLKLEAAAEPRIQGFAVVGTPLISKALDDQGQNLKLVPPPPEETATPALPRGRPLGGRGRGRIYLALPLASQREVTLQFARGSKPAKTMKELTGTYTTQMIAPTEDLGALTNVLKAAGQSITGKDSGTLTLHAIDKLPSGDYRLEIALKKPIDPQALTGAMILRNGMVQIQRIQIQAGFGAGAAIDENALPRLVDSSGKKLMPVEKPLHRVNFFGGVDSQEMTIVYHRPEGVGEPSRLIYHGTRLVNVTVPFTFRDVPLE